MSFSFGTPSSAPATGLGGGFNFGAAKPATPGFGLTATSQPSTGFFGSTPASSAPAFGSTAPSFGTSTAPTFGAANTSFGATSVAPAFGATTTPSFGSTPAFGQMSLPGFGATSTAPTFGATSAPSFGATTTPAFGATTTPAFGTTSTPAFGTTGLGGGLNFGGGSISSASTLPTFGATTTATTSTTGLGGLGGFNFGTSSGLWGGTSTATTSSSLFGPKLGSTSVTGTQPSTLVTSTLGGLGGVAPTTGIGVGNADAKSEPPKQQKLPNEISTTIDSFKEFVKKQKSLSSDVMRVSIKPLHKVGREAEATLRAALALSGETGRARAHSRRLRAAAAHALAAAEAVARDANQPGLELESQAPPVYVKELISELEQQLITFRRQMEVADKQMQASPKLLTEQELTLGIRRMHESLVALAGRLQAVHAQVEAQKQQYLLLRKHILKEPAMPLDIPAGSTSLDQILKDAEGSRKKSKSGNISDGGLGSFVLSDPRAALGNISQLAGPTPFTYLGSNLSPFPAADSSGPGWQPTPQPTLNTSLNVSGLGATQTDASSGFQLQKPPGKRGKQ